MIVDFHAHAFPDELAARAMQKLRGGLRDEFHNVLDGTAADLVRSMGRAGIDRSVVANIATAPKQVGSILRWCATLPADRIVAFGSVHPGDDPAADVRRVARAGLKGIKLHPLYQAFAVDDERMWPAYAAAEEEGLVILFHAGSDAWFELDDDRAGPRRILRVQRAFPELRIVAAHFGGWRMWDAVADVLAGTPVYVETSYTLCTAEPGQVERILERHPIRQVLFGTDSPWRDQADSLRRVRALLPDSEDRRLVLGDNAARILALDRA